MECASPDFHLKESFKDVFLAEFGGLEHKAFLFSAVDTGATRHGKQLFGRIPQLFNIPPSCPPAFASAGMIDKSSRLTKAFAVFSEFFGDCSPNFRPFCCRSIDEMEEAFGWLAPMLPSLKDEGLNMSSPSKLFMEKASAEIYDAYHNSRTREIK